VREREIFFPPNRRAEPGDVIEDLPSASVASAIREGLIEKAPPGARLSPKRRQFPEKAKAEKAG
jgi:hypothetical protein